VTALTSRERVWAALRGELVDRPPVSFWGHVYHRESSAADLVEHTLERQREYCWDWVKLNPRKHYHVEDWGVRYRYSGRPNEKPVLEDWPIHSPEDWGQVTERPSDGGALGEQIEAVTLLRKALPSDVPFIETVFTPLAVLAEMVPEPKTLRAALESHPNPVRHALEAVTATYEKYVPRLLEAGADGIFFATTDWGSRTLLSPEEHRSWSRPYDERILAVMSGARFNVLHVCKSNALLFELADYPVSAFSYDATDASNPSLAQALTRVPGALMGGISYEDALQDPSPQRLRGELARGMEQTTGRRWLIAPGCSIPPTTPAANLHAIRDAVDALAQTAAPPARGTRS
jgi:uroporphyrinogen decarboxylase